MHDALRERTGALEQMRASPLFSVWRLVAVLFVATTASLFDMFYLHIVGIETVSELVSQTIIHTIGLYGGFTLAALLGPPLSRN